VKGLQKVAFSTREGRKLGRPALKEDSIATWIRFYVLLHLQTIYLCGVKRFLAFILVIIVAVTALTPCCTVDDCHGDQIAKQDTSKNADAEGTCSPFFSCTTCPGFTTLEKPITIPAPAEYHPQYFEAHFTFLSSTYTAVPWQPPRNI
jgi:hypothetical protein